MPWAKIAILIGAVAGLLWAVWALDQSAYERGRAAGDARAEAAEAALRAAVQDNTTGLMAIDKLRAALVKCSEQSRVDVRVAQDASNQARADADRIAAELAEQNARRIAQQSGECRSWAEQAACGSVQ